MLAAATPADVVETEASSRPGTAAGPDVEPDAQPAGRGHRRVVPRGDVPADVETMSAKLANLPDGVSVERGRIEVRFDGAEDALARLYTLAQALGTIWGGSRRSSAVESVGRGGDRMTTEALTPAAAEPATAPGGGGELVLPQVIVDAGPQATVRGPRHVVTKGATPVLSPAEARKLLESIDTGALAGLRTGRCSR